MWFLLPLVAKFGDRVYEIAAQSLTNSGLVVTTEELRDLGIEMQTPEGQKKFTQRALHIGAMITSYKPSGK
jgi:L-asparagine transporter-like permease